jgi:hypothetical protein
MQPVDIVLFEEGDPRGESGYRTKNAPGQVARNVLIDRGESLVLRASLASVTHGDFSPNHDDGASLLVFEFRFLSNSGRRFKKATITLVFDDASGDLRNRPEVHAIAPPEGKIAINKATSTKDVKHQFNAGLNVGVTGGGGELGYAWEASQVKETTHATTLTGFKRRDGDWGAPNMARWIIEEDHVARDGIPTFLRAAVLLRRRDDVPFKFTIGVEYDTDLKGVFKRLIGQEKPDPVDPVQLGGETARELDDLRIATLDPKLVDLSNMKDMDIAKQSEVVLATLLSLPT